MFRPSVRFSSKDLIFDTLCFEDYSREEVKACWFSDREFQMTLERCEDIIEKDSGTHCLRGLEKWSSPRVDECNDDRDDAYDAVLNEQDAQREEGRHSDERISRQYRKCCKRSKRRALEIAKEDAKYADMYLERDRSSGRGTFVAQFSSASTDSSSSNAWDTMIAKKVQASRKREKSLKNMIVTAVCAKENEWRSRHNNW